MKPKYLLTVAMGLHLILTSLLCLAGSLALFPGVLNSDGIAMSYTSDSLNHQREAIALVEALRSNGILAWAQTPSPFHVKLYSLSYAIFGPLFGNTILCAEPLNALFYLATLCLVWKLGRLVFSREASAFAVGAVALWPTFLLHTTQLLRDPLFIVAVLALVYIMASLLTRVVTWLVGVAAGIGAGGVAALLWVIRDAMWEVILLVVLLGAALLLVRQIRERGMLGGNMAGAVMAVVISLMVPWYVTPYRIPRKTDNLPAKASVAAVDEHQPPATGAPSRGLANRVRRTPARVNSIRHRFAELYPNASSNIDAAVRFESAADIVSYIPRALAIGLFAPFPSMWFRAGDSVGVVGRMLSGVETLIMYVCEFFALICVWRMRRNLAVWLLVLIVLAGVTALGLVVINVGALYRMRYIFWILLILLGAEGLVQIRRAGLTKKLEGENLLLPT